MGSLFKKILENLEKILDVIVEERSFNQMYKVTPRRVKEKAEEIKVRLITITPKGKYIYETFTPSSGKKYRQFVRPVYPNKRLNSLDDNVVVHCSCPAFKYVNEVSLWLTNASQIINSNGKLPKVTNPKLRKSICKHLVAVMNDLKKRL